MGKDTLIDIYTKGKFSRQKEETGDLGSQQQSLNLRRIGGSMRDPKFQKAGAMHQKMSASAHGLFGESAKGNIEKEACRILLRVARGKERRKEVLGFGSFLPLHQLGPQTGSVGKCNETSKKLVLIDSP